ncbi:MAG: uridylate kinase, partial [Lentisphaeria bacterium]|nr:uridylate kinase [Lentisphaeria bacterium]
MEYQFELVGKIGSMALIRQEDRDIDYNIFSRIGAELKPGMIWVTSGATEIGRLDYIKRTGCELSGDPEQDKADYSSQGQSILMQNYRQFVPPEYGIRQILVEHTHFNDPEKSEHIRALLVRAARQKTIPIVNYNDPVSDEENRKMELAA